MNLKLGKYSLTLNRSTQTQRRAAEQIAASAGGLLLPWPPGGVPMIYPSASSAMGREHPKNFEPTWFGDSIGKWDGDTLVVDTIGFNGKTRLDTVGHPHSDAMHLVERFQFTDPDHIAYEVTVDDPGAYTRRWSANWTLQWVAGEDLPTSYCQDNRP